MRDVTQAYPKHLDVLRYLSALLLFTYGLSKLAGVQFTPPGGLARKPVGSLTGFELTWFFYGYSPLYAHILGLTQILGGSLLLFRRTAALGAALMLPVMSNIVLINLFFVIAFGALCTSAFLLSSMLLILWHDRAPLLHLFWGQQPAEPRPVRRLHWGIRAAVFALVAAEILLFWSQHHP